MKTKKKGIQSFIKITAVITLIAAIVMNLQVSFTNFVGEADAAVRVANNNNSTTSSKNGPRKQVDCVYSDGGGISVSITGVSVSHGTKKAGVEFKCENSSSDACTKRECGPKPL